VNDLEPFLNDSRPAKDIKKIFKTMQKFKNIAKLKQHEGNSNPGPLGPKPDTITMPSSLLQL